MCMDSIMNHLTELIFPIDSKPCGLSYGEWTIKWWQWLLSIPISSNHAFDNAGIYANVNQHETSVFFLCQTIEVNDITPIRRCTINSGKGIFMPINNWISILYIDGNSEQEMMSTAKEKMDIIDNLQVTIDDTTITQGLSKYRVASPCFSINLAKDNILGHFHSIQSNLNVRAATDGYWIFIKPLEESKEHHIHTLASSNNSPKKMEVIYELKIDTQIEVK
jgi:hypothetical protein